MLIWFGGVVFYVICLLYLVEIVGVVVDVLC